MSMYRGRRRKSFRRPDLELSLSADSPDDRTGRARLETDGGSSA
jgi:hypothetical protein